MRMIRTLALGASVLTLTLVGTTGVGAQSPATAPGRQDRLRQLLRIGLVAEIYGQALEAAGYTVDRNLGLGARQTAPRLRRSGQVDLVPEYVGSGLGSLRPAPRPARR